MQFLCVLSCFSHVQIFVTLWTIAHQPPLSMGFSRKEHWSGLPCPPSGDFLSQISNRNLLYLLRWQADSLPLAPPGIKSSQIYWANTAQVYVWLTLCLRWVGRGLLVLTIPENSTRSGALSICLFNDLHREKKKKVMHNHVTDFKVSTWCKYCTYIHWPFKSTLCGLFDFLNLLQNP